METPPNGVSSKIEVIDYYVETLERVLGRSVCFIILKKNHFFMCFNKFVVSAYMISRICDKTWKFCEVIMYKCVVLTLPQLAYTPSKCA